MEHIKDPNKVIQGKKNKRKGNQLEAKARAALTDAGYIICRWQNTVEFTTDYDLGGSIKIGRLVGAKPKWNFFTKSLSYAGTGFPDFVIMKAIDKLGTCKVMGLEVKSTGYLDPEEREKVKWYLDKKIFPKIIIAKKDKTGHMIFIDSQNKEELQVEELFK
jgi:hypothetical protein